ncbi:MAG: Gfo/Idh/MocA family oxidoreductase [Alphaproteobacteria bacterium]|nr:Gfo/Idh/MocA family oxidoreductase [Alphaproteobacteria bacterium]
MKSIGVGVIGTGFMGKAHALAFAAASQVFDLDRRPHLTALADADEARARHCAEHWGFSRATADWRALIADPEIEVVAVATPNYLHEEMALAALAAGKAVYCEKPMATGLDGARRMAERAKGRPTLLGYNYLRGPAVGLMKSMIAAGEIGEIVAFKGRFAEDYMADPAVPHSWRCVRALAGSGALGDLGSHLIGFALHLAGDVQAVAGEVATIIGQRRTADGMTPVENDDQVHAVLRFANGARGVIDISRVAWGYKNHLAVEITGSKGTLAFDQERLNELRLFRPGDSGFTTVLAGPRHPPYGAFSPAAGHQLGYGDLKTAEIGHLLRGIAGREALYPDFAAGLVIERIAAAIERASAERCWVDLAEL